MPLMQSMNQHWGLLLTRRREETKIKQNLAWFICIFIFIFHETDWMRRHFWQNSFFLRQNLTIGRKLIQNNRFSTRKVDSVFFFCIFLLLFSFLYSLINRISMGLWFSLRFGTNFYSLQFFRMFCLARKKWWKKRMNKYNEIRDV